MGLVDGRALLAGVACALLACRQPPPPAEATPPAVTAAPAPHDAGPVLIAPPARDAARARAQIPCKRNDECACGPDYAPAPAAERPKRPGDCITHCADGFCWAAQGPM